MRISKLSFLLLTLFFEISSYAVSPPGLNLPDCRMFGDERICKEDLVYVDGGNFVSGFGKATWNANGVKDSLNNWVDGIQVLQKNDIGLHGTSDHLERLDPNKSKSDSSHHPVQGGYIFESKGFTGALTLFPKPTTVYKEAKTFSYLFKGDAVLINGTNESGKILHLLRNGQNKKVIVEIPIPGSKRSTITLMDPSQITRTTSDQEAEQRWAENTKKLLSDLGNQCRFPWRFLPKNYKLCSQALTIGEDQAAALGEQDESVANVQKKNISLYQKILNWFSPKQVESKSQPAK